MFLCCLFDSQSQLVEYSNKRRSTRDKTPVVVMNCSWSRPASTWRDPAGSITIPRAIKIRGFCETIDHRMENQDNKVVVAEDNISVLTNPVVNIEVNGNHDQNYFIGNDWGGGFSCLCRRRSYVVPRHKLPRRIKHSRRPKDVQCLIAKFNVRQSQIRSIAEDLWDQRGDEGLNPTKKWSTVYNMLRVTSHMFSDAHCHVNKVIQSMDKKEGFDYKEHHCGDSLTQDTVREMQEERIDDEITQVAATALMAGSALLGLATNFPESNNELVANQWIEDMMRPKNELRCNTCGNRVGGRVAENVRINNQIEIANARVNAGKDEDNNIMNANAREENVRGKETTNARALGLKARLTTGGSLVW